MKRAVASRLSTKADGKYAGLVPHRRERTGEIVFSRAICLMDFAKIYKSFRLPLARNSLTV
jgi:hypothetical protein